jgi:hypothetical protein
VSYSSAALTRKSVITFPPNLPMNVIVEKTSPEEQESPSRANADMSRRQKLSGDFDDRVGIHEDFLTELR